MRPWVGPEQLCSNPIGLRHHRDWPITAAITPLATADAILAADTIARAIAGECFCMLGEAVGPRSFLDELRHVATLLLHLLTAAGSASHEWAAALEAEACTRTATVRGPP
jgi:hypothetical protein